MKMVLLADSNSWSLCFGNGDSVASAFRTASLLSRIPNMLSIPSDLWLLPQLRAMHRWYTGDVERDVQIKIGNPQGVQGLRKLTQII
jgi:hypothetical protein